MSQYLTRCGFKVMTCEDGDEAIAAMEGVPFNVIVSDIQMPRVNGLTLAEWIAKNRPELRIFIMTAFGSSELYQHAMQRGVGLYLEKPVDPKLLVELLATPLERSDSKKALVEACLEASDHRGSGEVVIRSEDKVGRVFFTEGQVAWATATSKPHVFTEALA
ncbi:MAG: response regulator, partial [Deltaproteobacteria bacterium]|nr:response regulator [Deltaproteobacteria bacterium]